MSLQTGFAVETVCRDYLIQQGLTWITSNYHCRCGEIDLIMRDQDYFVFVEVRLRQSKQYGDALESITYAKRRKILKTALYYMTTKRYYEKYPMRFDVLGCDNMTQPTQWIKNAFGSDF